MRKKNYRKSAKYWHNTKHAIMGKISLALATQTLIRIIPMQPNIDLTSILLQAETKSEKINTRKQSTQSNIVVPKN